jgi:hypothetical protein
MFDVGYFPPKPQRFNNASGDHVIIDDRKPKFS